jgi:hypothetical protein
MIEIAIDAVEPDWRPSRAKKKRPQRFLRAVDPTGHKKHKHTTAPSGHDFLISRVHGLACGGNTRACRKHVVLLEPWKITN